MGVTIKVNGQFNSLVHKGSMGTALSTAPDVCKTPSPGGPVPIPYPVIVSRSADLANGTTTVKVDGGNMAAVKGSEFSRCNGDEPGTAGGVVSQVNMKEAKWILYSFDVKLDGKNACRLADKMTMNHMNTVCLQGVIQGPVIGLDMSKVGANQADACAKHAANEVKDHDAGAKAAGMRKDDYDSLKQFSKDNNVCVSFRQTNPNGIDNIGKFPCKPMTCKQNTNEVAGLTSGKPIYTGDYDMHDLISNKSNKTITNLKEQSRLRRAMNNGMVNGKQFPRIMHGPQSTFGPWIQKHPASKKAWQQKGIYNKIREKYIRPGAFPGKPVTVFDNGKVYQLQSPEDVFNMYRCKGAKPPSEWKFVDAATGKRLKK